MKIEGVSLTPMILFVVYTRVTGKVYENAIGKNYIEVHGRYASLANKIAERLEKILKEISDEDI